MSSGAITPPEPLFFDEFIISLGLRLLSCVIAVSFAVACRVVYRDVLWASGAFDYMNLAWRATDAETSVAFLFLAALPALLISPTVRAPSDLMAHLLYVIVYVPTVALLPNISILSKTDLVRFALTMAFGVSAFGTVAALPRLYLPRTNFSPAVSVVTLAATCSCIALFYALYGNFSISNLSNVYSVRHDLYIGLQEHALLPYMIAFSIYAIGPFLIAIGLRYRSVVSIIAGVGLLLATAVISANKIALVGAIAVPLMWPVLSWVRRAHLPAVLIGCLFVTISGAVGDALLGHDEVPLLSWWFFFRIFGNSAFLSAGYFEFFSHNHLLYFSQSFLGGYLENPYELPYPRVIGQFWTGNPENSANGNLWADAFANLGHPGLWIMPLLLCLYLWVYNAVSGSKDRRLATAMLIMPASALANIGVHNAVLSGGLAASLLLIALLPGSKLKTGREASG